MLKRKYIAPLLSLLTTGLMLVLVFFLVLDRSLGWFANNNDLSASGMSVKARGVPETEQYLMVDGVRIEDQSNNLFAGLVPGDTIKLRLYVKNKENRAINFKLLMQAPTENDDEPYILDGLYHYMGTQIRINSVKNGSSELLSLSGNERYLLELDDSLYIGKNSDLPPTSVDSEYDFSSLSDKPLTNTLNIAANGEMILDIELEFVDNKISQNPYIEFGAADSANSEKAGLSLSRTLICYFE